MSKRTRIWLLVLILIIATFLRFYHFAVTPPGLYPDEAIDGNNAAEAAQTGHFQVFYTEDNGREGLYVNLIAIFLKVFPIHEAWVIRLPAAIAGVLTVFGLYFLVAELFVENNGKKNYGLALLAAFLLATNFWHINFSRIGFRAILAPLLLTWTAYFLLKTFRTPSKKAAAWYAIVAGIVYALGFYTYIAYRVTPLLLLLFIPFFKKHPDFWKRALLFIIVTFIVAAPIGWYFVKHPGDFFGRTSQISITSSGNPLQILGVNVLKTLAMFNFHGDDNWRHNVSGAPELFWPVGILFLIGFICAIVALIRRRTLKNNKKSIDNRFAFLFFFAWFVLAMLPVVLSNEGIPHSLRSILMLPPAIVFAALGGVWVYRWMEKYQNIFPPKTLAVIFFATVFGFAYADYFVIWAQNPNVPGAFSADYVAIGREINALPTSAPKYVVVEAGGVPVRGLPTPIETTMFITDSFTTENQIAKNIHYLLPDQIKTIPAGTPSSQVFYIR